MEGRPWCSTIFAFPSSSQREASGGTIVSAGDGDAAIASEGTAQTAQSERIRNMVSLQSIEGCTARTLPSCHRAGSTVRPAASHSRAATALHLNAQILRSPGRNAGRSGGTPGARPGRVTDPLAPFFLGAYGENNDFFEKTLLELVRDHVFWRRNFHPEDQPPIGT